MSCFIDFIDINLWEDKVREIHLDKSPLSALFCSSTQRNMVFRCMANMSMTDGAERTLSVPAFSG